MKRQFRRTGPDHDSSIRAGKFGDKEYARWVVEQIAKERGKPRGSCGEGLCHLPESLCWVANQGSESETNETWIDWWKWNKDKTQVDWIREGFQLRGITASYPLTAETTMTLLQVLVSTNQPPWLGYNAKRWLRDSGFRAWKFDLQQVPESERPDIAKALTRFAVWQGLTADDPGKLGLAKPGAEEEPLTPHSFLEPVLTQPWLERSVVGLMVLFIVAGTWLLYRARS